MIKKMLPSKNMVYLTNNLYIIRCYCWFNVRFIISVFVQVFTHLLGRILLAIFPEYIAMPGEDLFLPWFFPYCFFFCARRKTIGNISRCINKQFAMQTICGIQRKTLCENANVLNLKIRAFKHVVEGVVLCGMKMQMHEALLLIFKPITIVAGILGVCTFRLRVTR